MTVLGLKLSRRANAVSALHGEVSRAYVDRTVSGQDRKTPFRSATSPTACTCPPGWRRRCFVSTTAISAPAGTSTAARRTLGKAIEIVDDGELWETHLSLKSQVARIRAPPRRRTGRAPRRVAGNPAPNRPRAESGRADHRIRPPLRHLQARQSDPDGHRNARFDGQRSEAPGAVRLRRQGASARRTRQAGAAADRRVDAQSGVRRTSSSSSRTTTSTSAAISSKASMSG